MKNIDNRFAQISIGGDVIFANHDLELGVLGATHASDGSSIILA